MSLAVGAAAHQGPHSRLPTVILLLHHHLAPDLVA
jgi:hypothetical protein